MNLSVETRWPPVRRAARFALVFLFSAIVVTTFASPARATSPPAATDVAAAPSPGSAGIGDPYFPLLGNGGYDALHYTIDLDLDIERGTIVTAQTMIRALATQDLSAFNLDFRGPQVDAVSVDGTPADWTRDDGELIVTPAAPIASGQLFVVDVRYHGKPATGGTDRFERGWWATGDAIFTVGEPAGSDVWYPVNGHPLDKATYTLNVTVPEPYGVVANGTLTSMAMATGVEGRASTRTFTWENNLPTASYLVMFHAADLDVSTSDGPSGIALTEAFPTEIGDRQRRTFNRVPEMVKLFEELFGPYPFPWLGHTVFEDTAFDAALETQGMIGYDASAVNERTVAHEIAHQWFGNSVSPARWQDIWLNEGFARYAEVLWAEHEHGPEAAQSALRQQMASFAAASRTESGRGVQIGDPGPDHLFTEVVYAGGALLLDDLRQRVGDDTFFRILQEWASRYRHSNATTDDFIALAEEISGDDLESFFDDWLFTPWTPERVADRFSLAATPTP